MHKDEYLNQVNFKLKEIGVEDAKRNLSFLLEYNYYVQLNKKVLAYLKKILAKLIKVNKILNPKSNNFIVSMSFIDLGKNEIEPIFWDLYPLR